MCFLDFHDFSHGNDELLHLDPLTLTEHLCWYHPFSSLQKEGKNRSVSSFCGVIIFVCMNANWPRSRFSIPLGGKTFLLRLIAAGLDIQTMQIRQTSNCCGLLHYLLLFTLINQFLRYYNFFFWKRLTKADCKVGYFEVHFIGLKKFGLIFGQNSMSTFLINILQDLFVNFSVFWRKTSLKRWRDSTNRSETIMLVL